jgi:hypothetical protein
MKMLLGVFALASGTLAAQTAGPVMHEIPLLSCSGLPCVELTSNVNVMRVVIDLASRNGYLDINAAKKRGLQLTPLKSPNGSEISDVQQTVVPGAKLGDLPLGDFPFMVLDAASDQKSGKKKDVWFPADGALAFGSFQNRRVQLDWNKHVLRISEPMDLPLPCPRDCTDLAPQRFGQYGPETLTAKGFEIEGKQVTAQIDTLFTGSMFVYPKAVETLNLENIDRSKHKEEFPFAQGGLRLTRGLSVTYTFHGDALLNDASVYFWSAKDETAPQVSFDATVGTDLLSRALFTFDFKANKLWMESLASQQ